MPEEPKTNYRPWSSIQAKKDSRQESLMDQQEPPPDEQLDDEPYVVRQRWGYLSILFSLAQTGILITMMVQCGMAPLNINPMIGPYPDALSEWGGKNAVDIIDGGEWWRLITPIMLHAGVIHLIGNVAVQADIGAFFEREWGSLTWLIIYLVSAVGSTILSTICMPNSVSVGSSGAVMGIFGGKLAEVFCRQCESKRTKQQRIGHAVRQEQFGAVMCSVTVVMLFSFIPFVDWAAHLGGLVAGLLVGIPLFSLHVRSILWKSLWFLLGTGLLVGSFAWALTYMYSGAIEPAHELEDVCGYYKEFYEDYECNCQRDGGDDH